MASRVSQPAVVLGAGPPGVYTAVGCGCRTGGETHPSPRALEAPRTPASSRSEGPDWRPAVPLGREPPPPRCWALTLLPCGPAPPGPPSQPLCPLSPSACTEGEMEDWEGRAGSSGRVQDVREAAAQSRRRSSRRGWGWRGGGSLLFPRPDLPWCFWCGWESRGFRPPSLEPDRDSVPAPEKRAVLCRALLLPRCPWLCPGQASWGLSGASASSAAHNPEKCPACWASAHSPEKQRLLSALLASFLPGGHGVGGGGWSPAGPPSTSHPCGSYLAEPGQGIPE